MSMGVNDMINLAERLWVAGNIDYCCIQDIKIKDEGFTCFSVLQGVSRRWLCQPEIQAQAPV
jgi:hypothetical protein